MKVLLDSGSELNTPNEWKLTPVAIAFLKGHIGIAKYLLDQPGVDIDFRDDNGKTVLMKMVSDAKVLNQELLDEIKVNTK